MHQPFVSLVCDPDPGSNAAGDSKAKKLVVRLEMTFEVDAKLWADFEREAERHGVPVERLAEHAALYFAADRDAGRVTRRILEDMEAKG